MPEPLASAPLDTAPAPAISFAEPFERFPAAAPPTHPTAMPAAPEKPDREPTIERPVDFQPISRTKITPPLLRRETLTRGRLIDRLRVLTRRRLTLVVAEAGYGKTTLMGDFGRVAERPCLWYKLDANDGDWVTLANYLIAAIRELEPSFGAATESLLRQLVAADPPRRLVIDTLFAEIARLETPALLVLDDFHLVDGSADALEIVGRLLREAPTGISLVLVTRRRPDIGLARLAAQGEFGELVTEELRFSRGETDELFSQTYQQPLDPDVLEQLDLRTEGWAASLQLFHSSIRGRSSLEIRSFARSLSGSQGPVYDFLAEEVLRELTPPLRRFLIRAAILERIVPDLVVALFADVSEPPSEMVTRGWIEAADDLGLLGRRGEAGHGYRFHPLLQDFLHRQLQRDEAMTSIRSMHERVARAAEGTDWLVACHHFLEAQAPAEAVRVMGDSLLVAMGTGAWGTAASLLERFAEEPSAPAVQVILALRQIEDGDVTGAERRLYAIDLTEIPAEMRSLVRHALLRAAFNHGDLDAGRALVDAILDDPACPDLVLRLARSFRMLYLDNDRELAEVARELEALGADCQRAGLNYFAAVSFHNSMESYLAAGLFRLGYDCGVRALDEFQKSKLPEWVGAATHATLAMCAAELGWATTSAQHLQGALIHRDSPEPDGAIVAANLLAIVGDSRADELVACAGNRANGEPISMASEASLRIAEARLSLRHGDTNGVMNALSPDANPIPPWAGADVVAAGLRSLALLVAGEQDQAQRHAAAGLTRSAVVGAHPWRLRLGVIEASALRRGPLLRAAIEHAAEFGALALLETADAIVAGLDLLDPLPAEIAQSAEQWPDVWRSALRRRMAQVPGAQSFAAARVLARIGTLDDAPFLRAFERRSSAAVRSAYLSRMLVERASPKLHVTDLGWTRLSVGGRSVALGEMRRRAASLLVYLIARPRQLAPREKVLDDLWPDLSPQAAANSLNQTLYFLRRDIDPHFEDGVSVDYIRFEAETLGLSPELVTVESVEFHAVCHGHGKETSS